MKKYFRLILLLLLSALMLFCFCSCAEMEVDLKRDGSGKATVTVSKAALAERGIHTEDELASAVEEYLKDYNTDWTIERVKVKNIKENDESFTISLKLARIHKLENVGKYVFASGEDMVINSNTRTLLKKWCNGKFDKLEYTNGRVVEATGKTDFELSITDYVNSAQIDYDALEQSLTNGDYQVFAFLNYDVDLITEITLNLPGRVSYYSAETMEVTNNGKTVVIRPQELEIKSLQVKDGGVDAETRLASNYVGFVIYEESVSPALIVGIVALVAALGCFIFIAIRNKWFKRMFKSRAFSYIKREYVLYLMVIPGVVLLGIFCYGPMVGIYTAFTNYEAEDGIFGSEFVGLQNFINMFDPRWKFHITLRNTFVIALLKFVVGYPASVILALLFTYLTKKWFKSVMQTVSYLPHFLSWVMISGIAYNFLTSNNGIMNRVLEFFHQEPVAWYSDPTHWWTILTVTSVWKGMGYGTITFLAGLSAINPELYEAASIDGAGKLRQVFTVTLPGLMPVISFTLILNMGNLVKDDFEQILALAGENNAYLQDTVSVLGTTVFGALSDASQYSSGTAVGLFQSTISLILVALSNHILVKHDHPGIW